MNEVADFTKQFDKCLMNEPAFCSAVCPFGLDVRSFTEKISQNRLSAAFKQYADSVVFPEIVSELCDRPCEKVCPLADVDKAINIRRLEEFVTDNSKGKRQDSYNLPKRHKKIAVIGAGLSGLACALKLAQKKYTVTVYDTAGQIDDSIAENTIAKFSNEEWSLEQGYSIDSLDEILNIGFDAVYIATGAGGNSFGLDVSETTGESLPSKIMHHAYTSSEKLDSSRGGLRDPAADAGVCIVAGGALIGNQDVYAISDGIFASVFIETFFKTGNLSAGKRFPGTNMVLAPIHIDRYKERLAESPGPVIIDQNDKQRHAVHEAERCLRCRCDACMVYCDLPAYTGKWPLRIRDEVFITTLPGKAEVKATPAKRLINMDNLSGVFKDVCPIGIDMDGLLLAGRQSMHRQDKMPWAFHEFWLRDMEHANGESASLVLKIKEDNPSFAFFPGCQIGASSPELVRAAWNELLKSGNEGLILRCCGAPAEWAGDEELFGKALADLKSDWESLGQPALVCACPTCMRMLGKYLPEIETLSLYEVLEGIDGSVSAAKTKKECDEKSHWSIFDPCAAAQLPDPRKSKRLRTSVRVLAETMGIDIHPLPVQEDVSRCCGFGGQPEIASPEFIKKVRADRADEGDMPYICYCMNCREAFMKTGKDSSHILELRYMNTGSKEIKTPELSPSARRENREKLRARLLRSASNDEKKYDFELFFPDSVMDCMNEEKLLTEDIYSVVDHMRRMNESVFHPASGVRCGSLKIGRTTYWACYTEETVSGRNLLTLTSSYSHRLAIEREAIWAGHAIGTSGPLNNETYLCSMDGAELIEMEAEFSYLGRFFKHRVLRCPVCGYVFITGQLARGRMREVEMALEDK